MASQSIIGLIPPQLYLGFRAMMPGEPLWATALKKFALSLEQINGHMYQADLPSRGCSPLQFSEPGWWSGPDWLKDPEDRWPKLEIKPDEILVLSERRKGINLNVGFGVTAGIDGDIRVSGTTDLDVLDRNKLLVHQRFCQELRKQMWSCFHKEYLGQLIQRHGHKDCEIKSRRHHISRMQEPQESELAHHSCSKAFYWQRRACLSGEHEDQKWHIDLSSEKTVSSGGVFLH
ncbi:uncharacterized protein TNIN_394101 [Trichonephila inaurata madagascariensis]|uniref:Uncharacterized protein n=1 Tax=Trichonephila inaurata madagascariensis TaxID=2747483 RepID=A0A8X7CJ09_9ARAC|nr:uncharacterized protein TNIN_394101 [Trichonephila inaurata madagascariensis]